jgi:hypothetical protein
MRSGIVAAYLADVTHGIDAPTDLTIRDEKAVADRAVGELMG